jgi:hypothetical protein
MPLYQALGDDGFFLVRKVKRFWLTFSALLRKLKVGHYMHLLRGVRRDPLNEKLPDCQHTYRADSAPSGISPVGVPQIALD